MPYVFTEDFMQKQIDACRKLLRPVGDRECVTFIFVGERVEDCDSAIELAKQFRSQGLRAIRRGHKVFVYASST